VVTNIRKVVTGSPSLERHVTLQQDLGKITIATGAVRVDKHRVAELHFILNPQIYSLQQQKKIKKK
jgi:hypothetical protein